MNKDTKPRILVVDDEPSYRRALVMALNRAEHYKVDEASSGEEAIKVLCDAEYDLVILDHQMGDVSGLNVMQWYFEQKMDIPVIVLTGLGSETIAAEMMKLGAYDYVRKDQVDIGRFPVLVSTALDASRARKERQRGGIQDTLGMKSGDIIGMLENTSASFSRSAEEVLGLISEELDEYRTRVRPNLNPSTRSDLDRLMKSFQEQFKLVSLFTRTLTDLTVIARTQHTPPSISDKNGESTRRGQDSDGDSGLEPG